MTATATIERPTPVVAGTNRPPTRSPRAPKAPVESHFSVTRTALLIVAVLTLGFALSLTLGSGIEHQVAQHRLREQLQSELGQGTAPVGPTVAAGQNGQRRLLKPGSPIAILRIPSIGVDEVVGEGTSGAVLDNGPGHLRSTVFPGGAGTSVILGRAAAFGGPFRRLHELRRGARITVITGVGTTRFRVLDVRGSGDLVPANPAGTSRLELATATGDPFMPSGVTWVDADLVGSPLASMAPVVNSVPASEQAMGHDTSSLWVLLLWLQALAALLIAWVWTWHHRGRAHAWIVCFAPAAVVGFFLVGQVTRLLPNLL